MEPNLYTYKQRCGVEATGRIVDAVNRTHLFTNATVKLTEYLASLSPISHACAAPIDYPFDIPPAAGSARPYLFFGLTLNECLQRSCGPGRKRVWPIKPRHIRVWCPPSRS